MTATMVTDEREAEQREAEITALVDRWTAHMRWRKNYDRWREDRLWQEDHQMPHIRAIARHTEHLAGARVLDIGSGMGGFLIAATLNRMCAVGVEPSAEYCRLTHLRGLRYGLAARVIRGVGEALPCPDAAFDIVLAQDILEHVRDPDTTMREMKRVLAPGGVALVTVINRLAWRDPHYHLFAVNWLPRSIGERVVERIGRSKRAAQFSDNQRLGAMYYDTFAGFRRRARSLGFVVTDTKEQSLAERSSEPTGRYAPLVRMLSRVGLALPVYRLYRFAAASTFELALRHASNGQ
ncbi:MAG TPA: methyltransferase domain-containing protein [Thermomicrobiales bacterium]